ncbi:hypothetical protein F4859DRAFT_472569 [Xylaria cf. heliscus]|nr:hypothetical protein F4859DRAFT_472569 [Xylaria cf. heliscus]
MSLVYILYAPIILLSSDVAPFPFFIVCARHPGSRANPKYTNSFLPDNWLYIMTEMVMTYHTGIGHHLKVAIYCIPCLRIMQV